MSLIKLHDFAVAHGVTDRAIQKHLQKYADELEPHVQRKGPDGTWLTDTAQDILRSKMKTNPVLIMDENNSAIYEENKKLKEDLLTAYKRINEVAELNINLVTELGEQKLLAARTTDAEKRASEAEAAHRLADEAREQAEKQAVSLRQRNLEIEAALTSAEKENEILSDVVKINEQEAAQAKAEAAELLKRAEAAEAEAERLKNRGFWARLFNKE